jgi:hypothetical protein
MNEERQTPVRTVAGVPVDVWLCALLIGGSGVVFLVDSVIRLAATHNGSVVGSVVVAVIEAAAAAAVVFGYRPVRPVVLLVVVLIALLQVEFVLGGGMVWTRVVSGFLAAAHVYALVVLNTKPLRAHFGLLS